MTAKELLQKSVLIENSNNISQTHVCVIDPCSKSIILPPDLCVKGAENDKNSERIYFECPKIVGDDIDLSKMTLYVNYENVKKEKGTTIITDMSSDQNNIFFSWLIPREAVLYSGMMKFSFRAAKTEQGMLIQEWNTTYAEMEVLISIPVNNPSVPQEQEDLITQLLQNTKNVSKEAVDNVIKEKEKAISEIMNSKIPQLSEDGILFF